MARIGSARTGIDSGTGTDEDRGRREAQSGTERSGSDRQGSGAEVGQSSGTPSQKPHRSRTARGAHKVGCIPTSHRTRTERTGTPSDGREKS